MAPRLARLLPSEMDEAQRALYQRITAGPRSKGPQSFDLVDAEGGLVGPFNAMCLNPDVGEAMQQLGAALRYRGHLTARARELSILIVAAEWESDFERFAHEAVGLDVGLSADELAAIRAGAAVGADAYETTVVAVVRRLVGSESDLDDDAYRDAAHLLGDVAVFELTALVGYYALLALQLRVFRVEAPTGVTPDGTADRTP